MSTRTWTPQQRQAIEDRGGALLLSAAAGSGKTAVLTQRAVERLADENAGVEADRLLIVTFTNAAAAELRQRMTAALEEKLAQRPDSVWLKRQKLLLGRASICTVDSFCIDLLTQHASETDLPGDFTVIKTAQETALRQEALEQALEEAYQDEAFCRFASLYGKARSDRAAADAVLRLYDMACSMAQPEAWWASLPEAYAVHDAPADTAWGRELLEAAAMTLRGVQGRLRYALSLAQENEELAPCAEVLRDDLAQVQGLLQAAQAADWDACCARARALSFLRFPRVSKQADPVEKGRVQALRDEAKKLLRELPEKYFAADAAAFAAEQEICRPMVQALAAAVRRFSDLLYEKKQEAKAFAFDDLEHAALRLLQDENGERTPLSQELGGYYAMVMVDEYQDTNDLQDRLYRLLARPDGSNLFFVGDVKQSIYGFREARPEFFMQKRDAFAAYDGRHYPATVYLSRNFRSTPSVIRGINDIFAPLFCRAVGGTAYAGDEALTPGVETDPIQAPVQVIVTDTTPQEDAPPPPAGQKPDDSDTLAELICRMLKEKTPVRDGGALRPCRAGDFCILLRSPGTRGRRYAEKLEALGVGACCRAEDELLADGQVGLLLSFLRVLDNPGQDIPLAAVLLSPLFGFTPDDLTRLRLEYRRGSLYAALLHTQDARAAAFLQRLRALRRRSLGMPVQDICAMVLEETGLYHLAGATPGGESCQQNLRAFQAVCADYAGSGGLAGFLRLVDAAVQNGRPLAEKRGVGSPTDKVQVMSIHASKGLEFPIVLLAGAGVGFNEQDARANLLCHSRLGVAFKLQTGEGRLLTPTLAVRALAARMRRDTAGEEMRLLYVALTRAKDRLVLSWPQEKPAAALARRALTLAACGGVPDELALRQGAADGMSHWLQLALLAHPDAAVLRACCGWEDLPCRTDTAGRFAFSVQPAAPLALPEDERPLRTAALDAALAAALRENFAAQPAPAGALPVKVSVSALSHRTAEPVLDKPAFLYREGMTSAQRGTTLHRFLQLADLAAARQDLPRELERLTNEGYLEAEAAAQIDRPALQRFLHSALLQRMLSAQRLLREYEFISRIPAALTVEESGDTTAGETVFLLGIADCVLCNGTDAELVDYKTDRGKTPQQFLQAYAPQLSLYRQAIEKRLGVTVRRSVIYSFDLGREIEVP